MTFCPASNLHNLLATKQQIFDEINTNMTNISAHQAQNSQRLAYDSAKARKSSLPKVSGSKIAQPACTSSNVIYSTPTNLPVYSTPVNNQSKLAAPSTIAATTTTKEHHYENSIIEKQSVNNNK